MALSKCKECGGMISTKATACPLCGTPAKRKTSVLTWLVVIVLFIVFVPNILDFYRPSSTQAVAADSSAAPQPVAADKSENPEKPKQPADPTAQLSENHRAVQALFLSSEEPTVKDALWTRPDIFKVGVIDDGTPRDGYANYVCEVLYDYGFKGRDIWVQVIDIVKLTRTDKWVKLGEARCL